VLWSPRDSPLREEFERKRREKGEKRRASPVSISSTPHRGRRKKRKRKGKRPVNYYFLFRSPKRGRKRERERRHKNFFSGRTQREKGGRKKVNATLFLPLNLRCFYREEGGKRRIGFYPAPDIPLEKKDYKE